MQAPAQAADGGHSDMSRRWVCLTISDDALLDSVRRLSVRRTRGSAHNGSAVLNECQVDGERGRQMHGEARHTGEVTTSPRQCSERGVAADDALRADAQHADAMQDDALPVGVADAVREERGAAMPTPAVPEPAHFDRSLSTTAWGHVPGIGIVEGLGRMGTELGACRAIGLTAASGIGPMGTARGADGSTATPAPGHECISQHRTQRCSEVPLPGAARMGEWRAGMRCGEATDADAMWAVQCRLVMQRPMRCRLSRCGPMQSRRALCRRMQYRLV